MSDIQEELARMRVLLSPQRARTALDEIAPFQPPETIGAAAAIGFRAQDPEVIAAVYVFNSWGEHPAAAEKLEASLPPGLFTQWATNGRCMFFGYTRQDTSDAVTAQFRLYDLVSAFAGDE